MGYRWSFSALFLVGTLSVECPSLPLDRCAFLLGVQPQIEAAQSQLFRGLPPQLSAELKDKILSENKKRLELLFWYGNLREVFMSNARHFGTLVGITQREDFKAVPLHRVSTFLRTELGFSENEWRDLIAGYFPEDGLLTSKSLEASADHATIAAAIAQLMLDFTFHLCSVVPKEGPVEDAQDDLIKKALSRSKEYRDLLPSRIRVLMVLGPTQATVLSEEDVTNQRILRMLLTRADHVPSKIPFILAEYIDFLTTYGLKDQNNGLGKLLVSEFEEFLKMHFPV